MQALLRQTDGTSLTSHGFTPLSPWVSGEAAYGFIKPVIALDRTAPNLRELDE